MSIIQNHQVNVLVVDPDAESRGLVHGVLMSDGYGCRAVATAQAAIECAKDKRPDLLICDMNIGEESGLELFAQIRSIVDCPVLFTSDSRRAETVTHARRAGATYFLSKPFDTAVLMELVDKALWMPHLVRRHVDAAAHQVKAPSFTPPAPVASTPHANLNLNPNAVPVPVVAKHR